MSARARASSFVFLVGAMLGLTASAFADPVPDPLAAPGETLSLASRLYHSGAWIPLVIVIAFVALRVASAKIPWLTVGKRAAYTAAGLAFLSACAVPASQGTTPNAAMLLSALVGAAALLVNPTPPPAKAAPPVIPALSALLVLVLAAATVAPACTNPPAPIAATIDCAKLDQAKLEALALQLLPLLSGKSPDWSVIESQALAAGADVGGCVLAELVNGFLSKKGATASVPDTQAARAALEDYRARNSGGASYLVKGQRL